MKVYFSHSKKDYIDEIEKQCIEKIKKHACSKYYNNDIEQCNNFLKIINPRFIEIPKRYEKTSSYDEYKYVMNEYYFSEIYKCDILYYFPYSKTGKCTSGVLDELEYATENLMNIGLMNNGIIKMNFDGINIPTSSKIPTSRISKLIEYILEQEKLCNELKLPLDLKLNREKVIEICKFKESDKEFNYTLSRFSQWSRALIKDDPFLNKFNIVLNGYEQILYINKKPVYTAKDEF